jgi:L-rhamnose mutarotase
MEKDESPAQGKKIFFLYPHSVIRQEMLDLLIMAGYETYTIMDEKKAKKLLRMFPGSIIFINIDEGLKEPEWEAYIKDIMENEATKDCRPGIMSYNQDKELMQKYLMDLSIPCGYIHLKLGLHESTRIILAALEANEAKGRRKHLRADCADDINAIVNYKSPQDEIFHGKILDISPAGIASRFEKFINLPPNTMLHNVQLKLRGGLVMADMVFMGKRRDDTSIYILLFDPKITQENKLTIHHYIKICLQKYIDNLKV